MNKLEKELKALANKRRLSIVKYLEEKGEANVTEVARQIQLSFKSTSRHLAILRAVQVIERDQKGKEVYYRLEVPKSVIVRTILDLI